jgi:two-component system, NarL family, sensor kinase
MTRARRPPSGSPSDRREIASAVAKFGLSGLAVLVLVAVGGLLALRSIGTDEAVSDARRLTAVTGKGIVAPALSAAVVRGQPAALARLDRLVHAHVLSGQVVRVKVWNAEGRILYSDEPRLIGAHYPLAPDDLAALRSGRTSAGVSDLSEPENRFERRYGKLLQVYLGTRAQDGTPVLFEEYMRYDAVAGNGRAVWRLFAPLMGGALVVLAALQLPLAWRMARRMRDGRRERERLLVRAVEASDAERRSIAAGLHDGIVQELAGLSFSMAAAAERPEPDGELRAALSAGAAGTRSAIRQLRSLLLEIYPPRLRDHGLPAALTDLASPLTARGVQVDVDLPSRDGLPAGSEQLVFRVAQEAMRNVAAHAAARHVALRLAIDDGSAMLEVRDDGRGFDPSALAGRREQGHMGLQLLADLAEDAGGALEVSSAPGDGTTVRLEVPA